MKRNDGILAAALLAAMLLASGPAAAQQPHWYVGGGLGTANADFVRSDFSPFLETGPYTADDDAFAPRFFAGFSFAPNLAAEFGIALLGQYKHRFNAPSGVAVYNYDTSALTAAITGNLPLVGGLSLNGRAGIALTAATLQLRVDNGTATIPFCNDWWWYNDCTATNVNFYWGLGAQFDVSRNWGLRLDYDNYGEVGEEFETGRAKIETWSANLVFRF